MFCFVQFLDMCSELNFCIFLLRFVHDQFSERMQVAKVDFSTVLPRFISLYIFSFLSPKDLCAAAQVSWPWKFLTEQVDYLLLPRVQMQLVISNEATGVTFFPEINRGIWNILNLSLRGKKRINTLLYFVSNSYTLF